MLLKIPFEELVQALEGYDDMLFDLCPSFLSSYFHPAEVNIITRLADLAQLYSSIENLICNNDRKSSRYLRFFFKGVRKAILKYKQELRKLEAELVDPCLSLTAFIRVERYGWILEQFKSLLEKSLDSEPALIINEVYRGCCSTDPVTRDMFLIVRDHFLKPFFEDLRNWVLFGYLVDNNETSFFVQLDQTEQNDQLVYFPDKVPTFISQKLGEKIFFCGKVVRHFSGQESFPSKIFGDAEKEIYQRFKDLSEKADVEKIEFELFIEDIRKRCAKYSLKNLMEHQRLQLYLKIVKDFVLAGNEELIAVFLQNIKENVDVRCKNLKRWQKGVTLSLNNAVADFYNSGNSESIPDCFSIHLHAIPQCDELLRFDLKFVLPSVISDIFKDDLVTGYNKMFNFCVIMHQSRQKLSDTWFASMKNHGRRPISWFLLHRLIFLMNNLYYFYKVTVVERLHYDFCRQVETCQDIEAFNSIHVKFVSKLLSQSLLNIAVVERTLYTLFRFIEKACHFINGKITKSDTINLEKEFSQICLRLNSLYLTLKAYSISPTLPHLLTQIHNCINQS